MKIIRSWFKKYIEASGGNDYIEVPIPPVENTKPRSHFYDNYFSLIAEGARLKLLEAMFSLNIFALFENSGRVSESDIIEKLGLMPIRAKKWLHLLCAEHFLIKVEGRKEPSYQLPIELIQLIQSKRWWSLQFFFNSWIVAANENLTDVLRSGEVKTSVSWPPKTDGEAIWLEYWMTKTAEQPIRCLLEDINFKKVTSVLDVGGGDGTMACAFVTEHPHLKAAVYNLPKGAEIARKNIEARGLSHRVQVLEGDFIKEDGFQVGFDLILFTRVMFDWNEAVNRKLLRMAYLALPKNGLVGICEFYKEENNDMCLASEYRYLFHDDFAPHVMKTAAEYRRMLKEIGFTMVPLKEKKLPFSYCSLLLAKK